MQFLQLMCCLILLFHTWLLEAAVPLASSPPPTALPPVPQPAVLALVHNGSSRYVIELAPDALPAQKAAAEELQRYLELSTGVRLPLVKDAPAGTPALAVGPGPARKRGIDVSDFAPEEFTLATVGEDLVFAGRDAPGDPWRLFQTDSAITPTLSAVYTFLDRSLGVRWYWPGELGEEVPRRSDLLLPAPLQVRERPAFEERQLSLSNNSLETRQWLRRNRLGTHLFLQQGHNWYKILPEDRYLDPHPEYFALVNGVRGTRGGSYGHEHQACTTHPDVARIFAEEAIHHFKTQPTMGSFSIAANDGEGYCECDRCRALDVELDARGKPLLTDRLFSFFNSVARQVARRYPDRYLTTYAYNAHGQASSRLRIEPNLFVLDVYNFSSVLLWSPSARKQAFRNMALWRALTPNTMFVSYFYPDPFSQWSLPQVSSELLPDLVRHLHTLKSRGVFFALGGSQASFGHDAFLLSRLAWNPRIDPEPVLSDYYSGLFGAEAGALIRKYHDLIQKAQRELAPVLQESRFATFPQALESYRPLRSDATRLLDQAAHLPLTDRQRRRLEVLRANWDYIQRSLDGQAAFDAMNAKVWPDPYAVDRGLLEQARAAVEVRNAFVRDLPPALQGVALTVPDVQTWDKNRCNAFMPARLDHLLTGKRYAAEAQPLPTNRPTEEDWAGAPDFSPFVHPCVAEPLTVQTRVKALYSDTALFLRITALEPDPKVLAYDEITVRDGRLWTENTLEVFLDPRLTRRDYVQLVTNGIGTRFDLRRGAGASPSSGPTGASTKQGPAWDGDWNVTTTRGADRWTAEYEVPFATLEVERPTPGSSWGMNVARSRRSSPLELSAWAPTFGGFHAPLYFGRLYFR